MVLISIPGNDDARRSIDIYCNLLKETIENAKNEAPKNLEKDLKNSENKTKEILQNKNLNKN